ncbi:undecaprenyl-phosphate glucose phosphotransferase [Clostridium tagluense]|uniref:undecaprenyl-phosphate glucose phosphotransferase n=1 Tax=Clostridium tagluense TaxID=360422 RepID=UPI001C6E8588|nr:undecaprenyl-phosphate glucose phosphotransferase [Clostridium tagluense]MBW9156996.1 undecaprenyl-phosphate glucose phosphotransferase [Clostridium tagluense]WLC64983.1 undecaprenyl-phosphate glucose phosphotransferase [Clostridium tagluense]
MIKENQKILNRTVVVLDALSIVVAFLIAWVIRFKSGLIYSEGTGSYLSLMEYLKPTIITIPVYLVVYDLFKLYVPYRIKSFSEEIINIMKANIMGLLLFTLFLYLIKEINYSRYFLFIFGICNIIVASLARGFIRYILRNLRKNGNNLKHIVLVGYSDLTLEFLKRIYRNKQWGYNVIGIVDDKLFENKIGNCVKDVQADKIMKETRTQVAASVNSHFAQNKLPELLDIEVLGNIESLEESLSKFSVDEIFITLSIKEYDRLGDIIEIGEKCGVRTQIIPDYFRYIPAKPYIEEVDGLPIINIRYVPLDNMINKIIKRMFDVVGSSLCIAVFSPIMLVTALITRITSPGPVIFKQERVGVSKKAFIMYKYRSMRIQKSEDEKIQWTTSNDSRKTKFGNFIRRTSIDELPQLFNVLKGDMSLIGPRPERPFFVEKFKKEIPKYMVKHQVRPGITGWAQVNGLRGDTSIKKRIDCDIYYIENWSFALDIKIIFLTVFKGFVNKNAY